MQPNRLIALSAMVLALGSFGGAARAQATPKDLQVIARTLTFLEPAPTGSAVLGVVYAPGTSASASEAQALAAMFREGVTVGHLTLHARLIPAEDLASLKDVAAIFIAGDLGARMADVAAAARRMHVPTISMDMSCVQHGECTMGFSTTLTVQITLNRTACDAAGIGFIQAFRILVHEQ